MSKSELVLTLLFAVVSVVVIFVAMIVRAGFDLDLLIASW